MPLSSPQIPHDVGPKSGRHCALWELSANRPKYDAAVAVFLQTLPLGLRRAGLATGHDGGRAHRMGRAPLFQGLHSFPTKLFVGWMTVRGYRPRSTVSICVMCLFSSPQSEEDVKEKSGQSLSVDTRTDRLENETFNSSLLPRRRLSLSIALQTHHLPFDMIRTAQRTMYSTVTCFVYLLSRKRVYPAVA